ncbi:MAG: hypothetical protein RIC55_17890 [Pirellulaceae bacterium]
MDDDDLAVREAATRDLTSKLKCAEDLKDLDEYIAINEKWLTPEQKLRVEHAVHDAASANQFAVMLTIEDPPGGPGPRNEHVRKLFETAQKNAGIKSELLTGPWEMCQFILSSERYMPVFDEAVRTAKGEAIHFWAYVKDDYVHIDYSIGRVTYRYMYNKKGELVIKLVTKRPF